MCRLFGVYSHPLSGAEIERGAFLGMLGATNSSDSTGVYMLGRNKKGKLRYDLSKDTVDAISYFDNKTHVDAIKTVDNPFLMMGHCRWATIGAVTKANAQPILHDKIVLCHNGTIESFVKDKNDPAASDSKEFAKRLQEKSTNEALVDADKGAYAVSFCNFKDGTLNFARNGQRTLWMMYSKGGGILYWATELWMLVALKTKESGIEFQEPFLLSIDTIYSIKINSMKMETRDVVFPKKYETPSEAIFKRSMVYCAMCQKLESWCNCEKKTTVLHLPMLPAPPSSVPSSGVVKTTKWKYRGWDRVLYSISDVVPRLKGGCTICKKPQTPSAETHWFSEKNFVCSDCFKDNATVQEFIVGPQKKTYQSELVRLQ